MPPGRSDGTADAFLHKSSGSSSRAMKKRIIGELDRPVWFTVKTEPLTGEALESLGPLSVNEVRQLWIESSINGDTLVWTADKPYDDWEPIDSITHRGLKEVLLRPMLPPLPGLRESSTTATVEVDEDADESELSNHRAHTIRVKDLSLLCSVCGCLASVGCNVCGFDSLPEVTNGTIERVGSLENAVEVLPGFLWIGSHAAVCEDVMSELSVTHFLNATAELPNELRQTESASPRQDGDDTPSTGSPSASPRGPPSSGRASSRGPWDERGRSGNNRTLGCAGSDKLSSSKRLRAWERHPSGRRDKEEDSRVRQDVAQAPPARTAFFHRVPVLSESSPKHADLNAFFNEAYGFIEKLRTASRGSFRATADSKDILKGCNNPRILIYCSSGLARAPAIAAAYLVRGMGIPLRRALEILSLLNPSVNVGPYLLSQLERYDKMHGHGRMFCDDCFLESHNRLADRRTVPGYQLVVSNEGNNSRGAIDPVTDHVPTLDLSGQNLCSPRQACVFMKALSQWKHQHGGTEALTALDFTGVGLADVALKALTVSLVEKPRPWLSALSLGSNKLSDDAVALLVNTFTYSSACSSERPRLAYLDISGNQLGLLTAHGLSDYLKDDRCELVALNVGRSSMGDDATMQVVDALSPPEYQALVKDNNEDEGFSTPRAYLELSTTAQHGHHRLETLKPRGGRRLLNASLTALNISNNGAGAATYRRLKHAVRDNRVLVRLNLSGSQQSDDGPLDDFMEFMRYAAVYTTEVTAMDVSRCHVTDEICEGMSRMLLNEGCNMEELRMAQNAITANGVENLVEALKLRLLMPHIPGSHLLQLDLSGNHIGTRGATAIAEAFLGENLPKRDSKAEITQEGRVRIRSLELSGCRIGYKGFLIFGRVLQSNDCPLVHLDLSENEPESIRGLTEGLAVNQKLTTLDLSHNGLGVETAKELSRALRQNRTLKSLTLARNEIRDVGAQALTRLFALDENLTLEQLDLSFNSIGDDGVLALYDALQTSSSSSKEKKVLDLHLVLTGNVPTLNLQTYTPDAMRRLPHGSYDSFIQPHLARSKQTMRFTTAPYLHPVHDVSVWSRPRSTRDAVRP